MAQRKKWAVLVGIDHYIPGNARTVQVKDLKGCVNDVDLVEEYLIQHKHFEPRHIKKLTSSSPGHPSKYSNDDPKTEVTAGAGQQVANVREYDRGPRVGNREGRQRRHHIHTL